MRFRLDFGGFTAIAASPVAAAKPVPRRVLRRKEGKQAPCGLGLFRPAVLTVEDRKPRNDIILLALIYLYHI